MLKQVTLSSAWDAPSWDTAAGENTGTRLREERVTSDAQKARRGDAGNDSITFPETCCGLQGQYGVPEGCSGQQATFQRIHTNPSPGGLLNCFWSWAPRGF